MKEGGTRPAGKWHFREPLHTSGGGKMRVGKTSGEGCDDNRKCGLSSPSLPGDVSQCRGIMTKRAQGDFLESSTGRGGETSESLERFRKERQRRRRAAIFKSTPLPPPTPPPHTNNGRQALRQTRRILRTCKNQDMPSLVSRADRNHPWSSIRRRKSGSRQ